MPTRRKKNKYLLGLDGLPNVTQKKKSTTDSLMLAGTHTAAGLAGAISGTFLGRGGLLGGILTMGTGVFLGETHLLTAGAGMFAGVSAISSSSGNSVAGFGEFDVEKEVAEGKQRVENLLMVGAKKAVFADKLLPESSGSKMLEGYGLRGLEAAEWHMPRRSPIEVKFEDLQADKSTRAKTASIPMIIM